MVCREQVRRSSDGRGRVEIESPHPRRQRKCSIRRNLDDCNGSHQVEVAARRRANRQAPYGEDGADEFDSMVHTRSFISASTLDRHGRANLREGCRLYTDWLLEIHDRATEEACQMKVPWFETVDAGVMRVVSTVVMNIDAGEWPFAASDFEHLPQKRCGRSIRTRGAGPCCFSRICGSTPAWISW